MHGDVAKSVELSLNNFGHGIEYIDLLLLHCSSMLVLVDASGPIAFRAEIDGITVAKYPNGKVHLPLD